MLAMSGFVPVGECGHDGAERVGSADDVGGVDAAIVWPLAALLIGEVRHVEP